MCYVKYNIAFLRLSVNANRTYGRGVDVALEAFGPTRLMIGSDWPVCTLSGDYESVMNIAANYISKESKAAILGDNCARFYQIPAEEQL